MRCVSPTKVKLSSEGRWDRFFANTSFHGFPEIKKSETKILAVFWTTVTLLFLGGCCFSVTKHFIHFFHGDIKVHVETKTENQPELPYATICYAGGWNTSKMEEDGIDDRLARITDFNSFHLTNLTYDEANLIIEVSAEVFGCLLMYYFMEAMKDLNLSNVKEFHHHYTISCHSMVSKDIIFKNGSYGSFCDDAKLVFSWNYFYCYAGSLGNQWFSGSMGGAYLTFIDPEHSTRPPSDVGPFYTLELSETLIPATTNIIYLPVGYSISIALEKNEINRLSRVGYIDQGVRCQNTNHSSRGCGTTCFLRFIKDTYNCEHPVLEPTSLNSSSDLPLCDVFFNMMATCPMDDELLTACLSRCKAECHEVIFTATATTAPQNPLPNGIRYGHVST